MTTRSRAGYRSGLVCLPHPDAAFDVIALLGAGLRRFRGGDFVFPAAALNGAYGVPAPARWRSATSRGFWLVRLRPAVSGTSGSEPGEGVVVVAPCPIPRLILGGEEQAGEGSAFVRFLPRGRPRLGGQRACAGV